MGFGVPAIENFTPYDALQKLMSFTVVFLAAPLMMATGPAMSPAVVGQFPWYPKLFGTRQAALSIHFLGMAFLVSSRSCTSCWSSSCTPTTTCPR